MILFVLPIGIYRWGLSVAPDVPDNQLRWIMTPSPFAASLSVPIVGDRPSGMGRDIQPIEQPLAYVGVPIWVVSIVFCLAISLICHVVTLTAFRYRWWRARETV
jgi:hypothetical protein